MNWGALAGGAAKGFNETYKMLSEEEERELVKEERRQALDTKRRIRDLAGNTQGRVGVENDFTAGIAKEGFTNPGHAQALDQNSGDAGFDRDVAQSTAGVLRENAARKGVAGAEAPTAALPASAYSQGQADKAFERGLMGIDPMLGRKVRLENAQFRKLEKDEKKDDVLDAAADEAGKNINKIQTLSPDLGLYGLANVAKKSGLAVKFVEGTEEGSPGKILYTDPSTGKEVEITSFAQGQKALGAHVMANYLEKTMPYMGPKDAMQMMASRLQMQLAQDSNARAERGEARADATLRIAQDAAPLKNNLTVAQTNQANAAAAGEAGRGAYLASGAALNNARIAELNANRTDKEAAKPFIVQYNALPQEQRDGPEGMALLDQAEAAVAMKSGDFSKIKANTPLGRASAMYQEAAKAAAEGGAAPPNRSVYFAAAGFAPAEVQADVLARIKELDRRGHTDRAQATLQEYNQKFPQTPLRMPPPSPTRKLIEAIPR